MDGVWCASFPTPFIHSPPTAYTLYTIHYLPYTLYTNPHRHQNTYLPYTIYQWTYHTLHHSPLTTSDYYKWLDWWACEMSLVCERSEYVWGDGGSRMHTQRLSGIAKYLIVLFCILCFRQILCRMSHNLSICHIYYIDWPLNFIYLSL